MGCSYLNARNINFLMRSTILKGSLEDRQNSREQNFPRQKIKLISI